MQYTDLIIDQEIYKETWNRLLHNVFSILSEEIMESELSDDEKVRDISLLQEGLYGSIISALQYIKQSLGYMFHHIIGDDKRAKLLDLNNRYSQILSDYNRYKMSPRENLELGRDIHKRLEKLKIEVGMFRGNKNSYASSKVNKSTNHLNYSNISKDIDKKSNLTTSYTSGDKVGPYTTSVDVLSTKVWRKFWKDRCDNLSGYELRKCKARGTDDAIRFVRSKIYGCDRTVDPDGCKETLNNIIDRWMNKRQKYLKP